MPSHNLATVTDVADRPAPRVADDPAEQKSFWADAAAILIGVVMTMCACGYEFGHGDHDSYFTEAIHTAFPKLLNYDWYTAHTLQYHSAFSGLTSMLMRHHIAGPAFLLMYLGLVLVLHIGWLSIVRAVGGSRPAYVASVVCWLMIAAGRSLAAYHMLQDSELLAANVASVSMLLGFAFWIRGRVGWAGLMLGISGSFHLNYAVAAIAGWFVLIAWQWFSSPKRNLRPFLIGTAFVLAGSMSNILHALPAAMQQKNGMPLSEFLDLYVHFRHPHHYDPRSWTWDRWVDFLWTVVPAVAIVLLWMKRSAPAKVAIARRELVHIYIGLAAAVSIGLVFAGLWFVSATLVQMSLSRFAVYLHLFGCTAAGLLLCDVIRMPKLARLSATFLFGAAVAAGMMATLVFTYEHLTDAHAARDYLGQFLAAKAGLALMAFAPFALIAFDRAWRRPAWVYPLVAIALAVLLGAKRNAWSGTVDFSDYRRGELELCDWVKDPRHTPVDAIFLTPPADQIFTIHAERAIVVTFKNPAQLMNEMPEWRDRMQAALGVPSLKPLIAKQSTLFNEMDALFDARPFDQLQATAAKYNATYLLLHHALEANAPAKLVYSQQTGPFYLYQLTPSPATKP